MVDEFDVMRDRLREDDDVPKTDEAAPEDTPLEEPKEKPKKNRVAQVDYGLKKIGDELPEEPPPAPRATRVALMENLEAIKESPNEWFQVAAYKTPHGAAKVEKAIVEGKQKIPEDAIYNIESLRVANPAGHGRQHSVLCAMYVPKPDEE